MSDAIVWEVDYRVMTFGPERGHTYIAAETKQQAHNT